MADKSKSSKSKKPAGGKKGGKSARKAAPLGARETRELTPDELEMLRARLQRKFR